MRTPLPWRSTREEELGRGDGLYEPFLWELEAERPRLRMLVRKRRRRGFCVLPFLRGMSAPRCGFDVLTPHVALFAESPTCADPVGLLCSAGAVCVTLKGPT
jgi:hypothetical protein